MKVKTTKKSVKNSFCNIYSIGYCNAQNLLQGINPFAYSTGVYGWACDYYNIEGVCVSTGYSPIGENINYELVNKYENKAKKILDNYSIDYQKRKKRVNKLLIKLINEINN
tara:strand:+ start:425 stop:757 length:333 start_codon:yes stop_codon:yes gene_type:complete